MMKYISFYLLIMSIQLLHSFRSKYSIMKSLSLPSLRPISLTKFMMNNNYDNDTYKQVTTITSEANSKIKLIKALKLKKKRDEYQQIVLEGHRVISDAISNKNIPDFIVYTEKALNAPLSLQLKEKMNTISCERYIIPENIFKTLSDTVTNQGIIGVFPKPKQNFPINNDENNHTLDSKLLVILDNLSDPGNMGTLIRSSYGLGVDAIIVVNGCDVWSPKVLRSSMGCNLRLPILEWNWNDIKQYLNTLTSTETSTIESPNITTIDQANENLQIIIADTNENNIQYDKINYKLNTVIIIGSEAFGISKEAFSLPGIIKKTKIPMTRNLESFNAAIAGSILLAEASKQRYV